MMDDEGNEISLLEMVDRTFLEHKEGRILEAAYEFYKEDGKLTKEEVSKIEKIDSILKTADIVINLETGDARIVTDEKGQRTYIDFEDQSFIWDYLGGQPHFDECSNLNAEGGILEATYRAFKEPYNKLFEKPNSELTEGELKKLEGIDEILKAADIIVDKQTGDATIITDEDEMKEIELDSRSPMPSDSRCR